MFTLIGSLFACPALQPTNIPLMALVLTLVYMTNANSTLSVTVFLRYVFIG